MKKKLRVALLFGGKSAEHEISLVSARNIAKAMDQGKYDLVAIGIDRRGRHRQPWVDGVEVFRRHVGPRPAVIQSSPHRPRLFARSPLTNTSP